MTRGHRAGRPPKFGRPSRVVAFTLPEDAIERLRRVHHDLGWAIVKLLDGHGTPASTRTDAPEDVELVSVAERSALIVVNQEVIRHLPGVNIIPLGGARAFLALDIDRGMSDLELAVGDRLADGGVGRREHRALVKLQAQLRAWRRDDALRFKSRAIIVVERLDRTRVDRVTGPRARQERALRTRRREALSGASAGIRQASA